MSLRLFPPLALLASLAAVTTTAIAAESPAVNPFFAKAEQLYAEGDTDLALELYAKGLELAGDDVDAHIRYASLLQQQGRDSDALAAYDAGLKQNNASAELHVRLADLLPKKGRLADAYQHYQTAYQLEPDSDAGVDAYVQIARITKQNESTVDSKAEIEWSQGTAPAKSTSTESGRIEFTPETLGEFSLLHQRLQGEWCLEWVDVYKREDGVCRSQIDNGDYLFVNPASPVSFKFGSRNVLAAAEGGSWPKGIGADNDGNIYVADTAFGNFQIFDPQGRLLLAIGKRDSNYGPANFMLPAGLAVDEDGRVYLVDQYFRKVDVFRPASLAVDEGWLVYREKPE